MNTCKDCGPIGMVYFIPDLFINLLYSSARFLLLNSHWMLTYGEMARDFPSFRKGFRLNRPLPFGVQSVAEKSSSVFQCAEQQGIGIVGEVTNLYTPRITGPNDNLGFSPTLLLHFQEVMARLGSVRKGVGHSHWLIRCVVAQTSLFFKNYLNSLFSSLF